MKKFVAFLLHPIVVSLFGLIALGLLIWFAGPLFKFGDKNAAPLGDVTNRLICLLVLFFIWGLFNLIAQLRKNKNNQNLVQGLAAPQVDPAQSAATAQSNEELLQIGERFSQALDTLKNFKFKGKTGSKALYELPWYIIVGPPGSGKTTALINSGLEFPLAEQLGRGALQGVGGTRNCDWWFTNEAVLIDTAGRYTTQDSHKIVDANAWEGFLQLLKRNRRRRPINGAIVAISLQDLLSQSEDERTTHARTIRQRLDELMEKLEIRFPIYLMLTKADMVPGFSAFFEEINKDERDQVWGVSLPDIASPNQGPDFEFLQVELQGLTRRLNDRVLHRIHSERDIKRRGLIQAYPQHMENVASIAESFVRQAFMTNRFKFQPYLRGVYFTSGTQDGNAIDRLMTQVAANFGFAREAAQAQNAQGKSYFLTRLFREVIFPEAELVGSNTGYDRSMRWLQRGAYIGMAGLVVILALVWSGTVVKHKINVSNVAQQLAQFRAESAKPIFNSADVRASLPALNALEQASVVMDQDSVPWLSNLGLYDGRVNGETDEAYIRELKSHFLPKLLRQLEASLNQGAENSDLYNSFRIYVMFNRIEQFNKEEVHNWFSQYWQTNFRNDTAKREDLDRHLQVLLAQQLTPSELNTTVVAHVRDILLREPVAKRVYSRIRNNPLYSRKVDMLAEMGEKARLNFAVTQTVKDTLNIPVLYTKEGYDAVDMSADAQVIKDVANERATLAQLEGTDSKVDYVVEDFSKVSDQVKELYFADYIRTWSDFYSVLKLNNLGDVHQASQMLAALIDPVYSPIVSALQVGAENTRLTSSALSDLAEKKLPAKGSEAAGSAAEKITPVTPVDKYFKDINALTKESKNGPAPISSALEKVRELQTFIAEIALSPDPTQKSYEISKARITSGGSSPVTSLRAYASGTPEPLKGWLESLAIGNSNVISSGGKGFVGSQWKGTVYKPYAQTLMGRYPLNPKSNDEIALLDFVNFFKPAGILDAFYTANVAPFVDVRDPTRAKSADGGAAAFSGEFLRQMQTAQAIKALFFQESPEAAGFSLDFKPLSFGDREAKFSMEVGADKLTYNHGPKFSTTLKWTGGDEVKQIRLNFEDINGKQHEKIYTGQWALFRLLDDAHLEKSAVANTYIAHFSAADSLSPQIVHEISYEIKAKSANNALRRDLLSSFRLPETP